MHRHLLRALFVFLLFASAAFAQQPTPKQKMVATDHQKVKATITYELQTTNFAVTRWMIFMPVPPDLPSQSNVKVTGDPVGQIGAERSLLARKVRYIDIPVANPKPGAGVTLKMDVEATLLKRELVDLAEGEKPPKVTALTTNEKKYYLSSTTKVDHDAKVFKDWLVEKKLRRAKTETAVEFAARTLEVIRADYTYNFDPDEVKRASLVCQRDKADCAGMSYVFVATMRANDIPARILIGRIAKPREPGTDRTQLGYNRPHVRAEMYVTGIGWVPVDSSDAQAGKKNPVTYFIGRDPGNLLVLHVDVDLQLPYSDKIREAASLQTGPNYWTNGKGTFDGKYGPTGWELKATPIEKK